LTLVCAPAGFGKTVALAAAAAASPWPVVWLSHTHADRSLTQFVRTLVAAIQQYAPEACRSTLSLLELPERPSPAALAQMLEEDLDALPDDCVVAIDDYHRVSSAAIDFLMVPLLERLPPQVHLLVASRTPPAWPLATLRATGRLAEVEADQLRFTGAETRKFLARATDGLVDEATSGTVQEQMGGWAAAVRLASIALRQPNGGPDALLGLARRVKPRAIEYLLDEVVVELPPRVQGFLVRTAICGERISPALADALLAEADGVVDSAAALQQLERDGLFVTCEDEAGEWYRYHDLLRAALRRRLREQYSAEQIRELHSRASSWFAQSDRVVEAVRHALAAGERYRAGEIIAAHVPAAFEWHQWARVAEWLELLPAEVVDDCPELLLAAGWVAHRRLQYNRLLTSLERVRTWLGQHAQSMPPKRVQAIEAECDAQWAAFYQRYSDAARAVTHARSAWERLPAAAAHARGQAGCTLGLAAQVLGQRDVVEGLLESERAIELRAYPAATLHVWLAVMHLHFATGDLGNAEQAATYILRRATDLHLDFLAAWAHYFLGRINYEWGRLDVAATHFEPVVDLRHSAPVIALRASLQGLARTYVALGRPVASSDTVAHLLALREGPCFVEEEVGRAFEAHLAFFQGDLKTALDWLDSTPHQPRREVAYAFEFPAITRVELLLAEGSPSAVAAATAEVAELLAVYTALHDTVHEIKLLVLQAMAADAQGNGEAALATLDRAVQLGMPGGFIRTFADRSPALGRLLARLPARDDTREYVERLRAACAMPRDRKTPPVPHREALLPGLIEPLSPREQEVLELLVRRFTNKEVANTLCISWQTVAKHTNNIYEKLRVSGRREAVERAAALGILPPDDGRAAGA
jgi:LuxR family maltose regulon positive regulatory protein